MPSSIPGSGTGRAEPLLEVRDLRVRFPTERGEVRAVDGISFRLHRGRTLAVVGESGSGKTVTFLAVMGLLRPGEAVVEGAVLLEGRDLLGLGQDELRRLRGRRLSMVFQDPAAALHPYYPVGKQIVESVRVHQRTSKRAARGRAEELLRVVGIPGPRQALDRFAHELSGGMQQRALIAMALAGEPDVLIADEPTSALDVTVQAQILELIARLQEELSMSVVLVTHDLGVVAEHADDVVVLYAGRVAEYGSRENVYLGSHHPYTWGLLRSVPRLDRPRSERLRPIAGRPPSSIAVPSGCPFHPRCPYVMDVCPVEVPPLLVAEGAHASACHLPLAEKERIFSEQVAVGR